MENSKKMSGGGYELSFDFLPRDLMIPDKDIEKLFNIIDNDIKQVTQSVDDWLKQIVDDD